MKAKLALWLAGVVAIGVAGYGGSILAQHHSLARPDVASSASRGPTLSTSPSPIPTLSTSPIPTRTPTPNDSPAGDLAAYSLSKLAASGARTCARFDVAGSCTTSTAAQSTYGEVPPGGLLIAIVAAADTETYYIEPQTDNRSATPPRYSVQVRGHWDVGSSGANGTGEAAHVKVHSSWVPWGDGYYAVEVSVTVSDPTAYPAAYTLERVTVSFQ